MKAYLSKIATAEAAHRNADGDEKQRRLHGHSYCIEMLAEGPAGAPYGWVVDFGEVKQLVEPVVARLDHAYLNELPGLEGEPTLANIERWIMAQVRQSVAEVPAWFAGVRVSILGTLDFRPVRLPAIAAQKTPERIGFGFEAAQSLPQLLEGHPCRNLHGHSYWAEAGAADLGRLEGHLAALYEVLDHQYLNDIAGLECATCERICQWIWQWLEARGVQPAMVAAQETRTARCLYFGEDA